MYSCSLSSLQFIMFMKKMPWRQRCWWHFLGRTNHDDILCHSNIYYVTNINAVINVTVAFLTQMTLKESTRNSVNGKFLSQNTRNQMVTACTKSVTRFINNWWLMIMFRIAQSVFKMIKIADETVSTRFEHWPSD